MTYAAWDTNLDVPVAVKEYFPTDLAFRDVLESDDLTPIPGRSELYAHGLRRFYTEAQVLAGFRKIPGVAGVTDHFGENGTAYIVMEFIHGVPLEDYVRIHKPAPRAIIAMLEETILALADIHRQGVQHRDITPRNLLVQEDGSVKLIDFGSTIRREQAGGLPVVSDGYSPPEQYTGNEPQDPWGDVYGVCATLLHMITGQTPRPPWQEQAAISSNPPPAQASG